MAKINCDQSALAHAHDLFYNSGMKTYGMIALLGATLCLTGCFTVDKAAVKPGGGEHVVMNNYGWKFFDWIPLVCGNASEDATMGMALFRDDVTFEKIQGRLASYANGRTVDCPMYDVNDTKFISVLGIPIPYVITYKEITLSGTVK